MTAFVGGADIVKLIKVHVSLIAMRLLAKHNGSFKMRCINSKVALLNFSITYQKALFKGLVKCDWRILSWTQRQISWMCLIAGNLWNLI